MKLLILSACILFAGCAGVTEYEVTTPDGVLVKVKNTKDYESYSLNARKEADGSYSVNLVETGVSASNPLKAAQNANDKLLESLLSVIPAREP